MLKKTGLLFLSFLCLNISWSDDLVDLDALAEGGRNGSHGMVLYGSGPYYVSHLPISSHHGAHNLQIIARVSLRSSDSTALEGISFNDQGYSIQPLSLFSLNNFAKNLALNDEGTREYNGNIFRGNFEDRQSRELFRENIKVIVEEILVVRKLPPTVEAEDFIIGAGQNSFRVNKISPEQMFQKITHVPSNRVLWCLNGPDFIGPRDSCL